MISIETQRYKNLLLRPEVRTGLRGTVYGVMGFLLSGASLCQYPMPLAMGAVWACDGWPAVLCAAGGILGSRIFWGQAGQQAAAWILTALVCVLTVKRSRTASQSPFLMEALAALTVSALGVIFQNTDDPPAGVFLLRVALGVGACYIFCHIRESPLYRWTAEGLGVLALAQIAPVPWLNLGFFAAGALSAGPAFPAAALAGLALDLAQVTTIPMTAVTVLSFLPSLVPRMPKTVRALSPALMYIAVTGICRQWNLTPLPALLLGGGAGICLHPRRQTAHRRGEVGIAQVRLEMAAEVLTQTQQLLLEVPEIPVDEDGLVNRAVQRACGSCPCRRNCRDLQKMEQLPGLLLHRPLQMPEELPVRCRKSGRMLAELRRSQEQARSIQADRNRQREYRAAVIQQYCFGAEFLQDLADQLPRRTGGIYYEPEVNVYGNRPETDNGDRCVWFSGTLCKYYVLLCDGMGTGPGAVQEGKTSCSLLRRMLAAGYPAEYALRSLNSLCALRNRAGAVTVDLAELDLGTGKAAVYKWGAVPSYVVGLSGCERVGTAGPPPGLSVTDCRETRDRIRLGREKMLVMVSDGVEETAALNCCSSCTEGNELAHKLIACGELAGQDDVTVVTVSLRPAG